MFFGNIPECFYIFWKTRTSITCTRIYKMISNTLIRTNSDAYFIGISPYLFTDISHFIHKGDFGSEHGIGRILGHLCRANIHGNKTVMCSKKRSIQFLHFFKSKLSICSNNHSIWLHKISNSSSLF